MCTDAEANEQLAGQPMQRMMQILNYHNIKVVATTRMSSACLDKRRAFHHVTRP